MWHCNESAKLSDEFTNILDFPWANGLSYWPANQPNKQPMKNDSAESSTEINKQ